MAEQHEKGSEDGRKLTLSLDGETHIIIRVGSDGVLLLERRVEIPDLFTRDGRVRALQAWINAEMEKAKADTVVG